MADPVVERRERLRARAVVGTVLAVLIGTAFLQQEAWPLSSYRLFSHVRTEEQVGRELIAIAPDGSASQVRFGRDNPVLATTAHLLDDLHDAPQAKQRPMVTAWLELAGIDPDDVDVVRVDVVRRTLSETGEWIELSRATETQVEL